MECYALGKHLLPKDRILSCRLVKQNYICGFDDSDRPENGFLKKLFYKPKPVYKEAEYLVIHYLLPEKEPHVRSGITHRTAFLCLCQSRQAYEAQIALAKKCQDDYSHAPNEKRTRLERSEEFFGLRELGLMPSLISEPDTDDGASLAVALTHAHGGSFITYSYLIADFDEFCTDVLVDFSEEKGWPEGLL